MGITPRSEAQHRASTGGGLPGPERIDPVESHAALGAGSRAGSGPLGELWSVAMPMPHTGQSLDYTLSVVHVGPSGSVTIVDPGWDTPEVHARHAETLQSLGRSVEDIAHLVVTHAHPDHIGAARELRRVSGARLYLHEREQAGIDRARVATPADPAALIAAWGVPAAWRERVRSQLEKVQRSVVIPPTADVLLRDGDRLPIDGFGCEVVPSPGHTAGHICLVDRERGVILTGDHVLPNVFPGVGLGLRAGSELGLEPPRREHHEADSADTDPVGSYLASLERLAPFDSFEVLPGHGFRFTGLGARRREMADHVSVRARQVAAALAADPDASIWQIASRLDWSAGWDRLSSSPMLASALLQTGYYSTYAHSGSRPLQ